MRNTSHQINVLFNKSLGTASSLIAALLLSAGCAMSQPGHSTRGDPSAPLQLDASQEAIEKCKVEAASRWQANFQESTKAYGRLGQESGSLFDMADGSRTDSAARIGEAAGKVMGTLMGMFERNSFQEKAIRDCLAARSDEMSG